MICVFSLGSRIDSPEVFTLLWWLTGKWVFCDEALNIGNHRERRRSRSTRVKVRTKDRFSRLTREKPEKPIILYSLWTKADLTSFWWIEDALSPEALPASIPLVMTRDARTPLFRGKVDSIAELTPIWLQFDSRFPTLHCQEYAYFFTLRHHA